MPKYWGKQIFAHGRFPEVGQKQKTEKKREDRKLVITTAKLCMAHASRLGKKKISGNSGQICFCLPPQVEHASRPDQIF